jgi:hypothetical protein
MGFPSTDRREDVPMRFTAACAAAAALIALPALGAE